MLKNKPFHIYLRYTAISLWILISFIAINHLFVNQYWTKFYFSKYFLGILLDVKFFGIFCWFTFIVTFTYLGREFFLKAIIIFSIFFVFGYIKGPYLEPPSDPFEHLRRTHKICNKKTFQIPKKNRGLIHYSMTGLFLCKKIEKQNLIKAESKLDIIDFVHGLMIGILALGLFILAKNARLPDRWAIFSILVAFLFMGTNRFSYISYYSLAPSFTSMLIYWLWTAVFFFKEEKNDVILGVIIGALLVPIIMVNHLQEAFFIVFIVTVWLLYNLTKKIHLFYSSRKPIIIYYVIIFFVLFLLPQFKFFQLFAQKIFIGNYWQANQKFIFSWHGWHIMGKIWNAHRVSDTLGLINLISLLIVPVLFYSSRRYFTNILFFPRSDKIIILGILPFIGFCVPLFHFAWASNTFRVAYYRMAYSSFFWILITYFLLNFEKIIIRKFKKVNIDKYTAVLPLKRFKIKKETITKFLVCQNKYLVFIFLSTLVFLSSSIRSGPIYGKLDFILLDNKPWWPDWKEIIEKTLRDKPQKAIYSDPITSTVIGGIYNIPVVYFRELNRQRISKFKNLLESSMSQNNYCLINLKGFPPSWVPKETGHWQWDLSYTNFYYGIDFKEREEIKEKLKKSKDHFPDCNVYY